MPQNADTLKGLHEFLLGVRARHLLEHQVKNPRKAAGSMPPALTTLHVLQLSLAIKVQNSGKSTVPLPSASTTLISQASQSTSTIADASSQLPEVVVGT